MLETLLPNQTLSRAASNPLLRGIMDQMAAGLLRKSAKTGSRWAELYRVMPPIPGLDPDNAKPRPLTHRYHPWTRAMRDERRSWCSPKAAQMGETEVGLDVALFNIDYLRRSVLYLLPNLSEAADFSKSRFDAALDFSPYLRDLFQDVSNVKHKMAGSASLFIRGTKSKSGVKSLPVDVVIMDEFDEMVMKNIRQATERMSGRVTKQLIKFSTPTVPDFGIDAAFKASTQDHYFFKCPKCSRSVEFIFPDDLIITGDSIYDKSLRNSYYQCNQCHNVLEHETKRDWITEENCEWVSTGDADADERGFYINQFYSFTVSPYEIAKVAMLAEEDPAEEQEFWNSKGGKPHITQGSNLSEDQVLACRSNYISTDATPDSALITLGIDQGKKIYYEADQWFLPPNPGPNLNRESFCKVLDAGFVDTFEDLDVLMKRFQVQMCVMDYNPERRKAQDFRDRFRGYVRLCYYTRTDNSKDVTLDDNEMTVKVHRASWLDQALGRVHTKRIILPKNISKEYARHLAALVRVYDKDKDGNPIAKYLNKGADHLGHARNYAEIALPLALARQTNRNASYYI
jgi:hypothetical protein